ncbi:hypothetical protein [Streptomyces sp. NBC_00470]|uniref:hypothetical protein n=1 Tax=Streptomyces sp. NBC_00470 TaxID=2975753 RepID=UPI0030DF9A0C
MPQNADTVYDERPWNTGPDERWDVVYLGQYKVLDGPWKPPRVQISARQASGEQPTFRDVANVDRVYPRPRFQGER